MTSGQYLPIDKDAPSELKLGEHSSSLKQFQKVDENSKKIALSDRNTIQNISHTKQFRTLF